MAVAALALLLAGAHGVAAASAGAGADADCAGFQWDMSRELALFGTEAVRVVGAADPGAAPAIEAGRLYEVALKPQAAVRLRRPPQAHRVVEAPSAGLVTITVREGGHYRISADGPLWIDAIDGTAGVAATAFNGHARCALIHKSVEFVFPAGVRLLLELSQSPRAVVRIAVTPAPDWSAARPQ